MFVQPLHVIYLTGSYCLSFSFVQPQAVFSWDLILLLVKY